MDDIKQLRPILEQPSDRNLELFKAWLYAVIYSDECTQTLIEKNIVFDRGKHTDK